MKLLFVLNSATTQILALLLAQRDALRGILFTTAATPTLQMLQEARLITQLMRTSLSVVSQEELVGVFCMLAPMITY